MLELIAFASTPFYPQNFGVDLIATWSDGDDSTAAVDVEVKGGWVYLIGARRAWSTGGEYLWVLDAREPEQGVYLVNSFEMPHWASDLVEYNGYLFAIFGYYDSRGLQWGYMIYSLEEPSNPKFLGIFYPAGSTKTNPSSLPPEKGIGTRGMVIYVNQEPLLLFGAGIASLKRPDSPTVYFYEPNVNLREWGSPKAFLPPKYLYAFTYDDSIAVVDLSDPRNPKLLNKIPVSPYSWSGTLWFDQDSTPYLVIGTLAIGELEVYSLQDPEKPVLVNVIPASSRIVASYGSRVYCSEFALYVLENLAERDTVVGFYDHKGAAREIVLHKNLIYMANRLWGDADTPQYDLYIFHYQADTPQTLRAWFSKGKLFFELPSASELTIKLYDLKGSLILKKELSLPWGESSLPLNLPSRGIYLALVERKGTNQRRVVKCYY